MKGKTSAEKKDRPDWPAQHGAKFSSCKFSGSTSDVFLHSVVENIPDMIFIKDAEELRFVLFNKAGEELLGYKRAEMIGKNDYDLFPKDQADFFTRKDLQVLERGHLVDISEEPINTRLKGRRILHTKKIPLCDVAGRPRFLLGISEDITEKKAVMEELRLAREELEQRVKERTAELAESNRSLEKEISERKRAEEEVAAEKERLNVTLRSIAEAVIVTDARGRILLSNSVFEQLIGKSESEILGTPLAEVLQIRSRHSDQVVDPMAQVPDHGEALNPPQTYKLNRENRGDRLVTYSAAVIKDEAGIILGSVLVIRDVTAERRVETELLRAQKLESVAVLAGGLAHDFNNLLSAVIGNLSLARLQLKSGELAKLEDLMQTTEQACLRAKGLTDQLLTFSREGVPVKNPVCVRRLLEQSCALVLGGSRAAIKCSCEPELRSIDADESQIAQVLHNLLINADQAMPNGGVITVTARNFDATEEDLCLLPPGPYVAVSIGDGGMGITKENLPRIFDPFFTTKENGTGLGLAAAYTIIKNHEGKFSVQSTPGIGTVFTIYLPASRAQCKLTEQKIKGADAPIKGEGRILLIDDEPIVRETTETMLDYLGYQTVSIRSSEQGLALFQEAINNGIPFDAVIMDLTIPGSMNGKTALECFLTADPQAKIVITSGHAQDPVMVNYHNYGFAAAVIKPYAIETLSRLLAQVLNSPG